MQIELLADHPECAQLIGKWHWEEWGHADPAGGVDSWIEGIASRNKMNAVPMTHVALAESGELLGSVSLVECDMDTHPELSALLAGLYVDPAARRSGVGSALTMRAYESAMALGIDQLYLYTSKAKGLYLSLGWVVIGTEFFEGEDVSIMCKGNS